MRAIFRPAANQDILSIDACNCNGVEIAEEIGPALTCPGDDLAPTECQDFKCDSAQSSLRRRIRIWQNPHGAGADQQGNLGRSRVQPCAIGDWSIVVKDRYPAYITWETFERIQAILRDNHADYVRKGSRGVPRSSNSLIGLGEGIRDT